MLPHYELKSILEALKKVGMVVWSKLAEHS